MSNLGLIILAAGGSTRMGQAKQLLKVGEQSLIRKTVETALAIEAKPVLVVLGNAYEEIHQEIADLPIEIVFNKVWEKGMAGSLRIGIDELTAIAPHLDSVLILLCDQPLITVTYLEKLYQQFQNSQQPAIASFYNKINGVPAIFDFQLLQRFTAEQGDFGARYLLKKLAAENQLEILPFPEGAIDLDTPEDYERFLRKRNK